MIKSKCEIPVAIPIVRHIQIIMSVDDQQDIPKRTIINDL